MKESYLNYVYARRARGGGEEGRESRGKNVREGKEGGRQGKES